jgi:hypothetical protein
MAYGQSFVSGVANYPPGFQNSSGGPQGDSYVSEIHGKWATAARQGRLFHGSSAAAGIAIPLYTATTQALCLWNTSTNVDLELVKYSLGYVSGTTVAGPVMYALLNAGYAYGTGSPIATFTNAPTYMRPGRAGSGASQAQFANVTVTTTAALPVAQMIGSSISQPDAFAAASTTAPVIVVEENFDGSIIVPPGWAFFPMALLASVSLYQQRIVWIENPVTGTTGI